MSETKLVGIYRNSFPGDDGKDVEYADLYIETTGVVMVGLEGITAASYRIKGNCEGLKLGKVNMTFMPGPKGSRLVDIQNI